MISKIGNGHPCPRKHENPGPKTGYITLELQISIMNIANKPCQCLNTDYGGNDTFGEQ